MNESLQDLEIKVENQGKTPQGRVSAAEWNVLVAGVKALDLAGFNENALRDYLEQYDYITRPELEKALEGIGGNSGGSGIAYPLTWSGYSSGMYDGSAPANISIPSLLSQLTNDSDYITSASVNSLLTDYLSKSGGTITGDFFLKKSGNATIIFQPSNAAKNFWIGVNTSEEWFCTNGGYTETYKLIHSGNFSVYGGVWLANAGFNANAIHHGFRAGKAYNAKGLIDAYRGFLEYGFDGYAAQFNSNSENDLFYRWCENGTWLNWRKVAFVDTDSLVPSSGTLSINGIVSANIFKGSFNGQLLPSLPSLDCNNVGSSHGWVNPASGYTNTPFAGELVSFDAGDGLNALQFLSRYDIAGLYVRHRLHINNNWSSWHEVAFIDSTLYPTGDIAIQFPEGEYIDRYGNIVLPSTAGQWSVKQGNALLAVKVSNEVYVKGWLNFDKTYGSILTIRDGRYGQSAVISVGYTNQEGDMIKLHIPSAGSYDHHLMLSQCAGATLTMGLKVNGNFLATGEITQHSSLVLKDVVDTRFLTLEELVALKPYSFRWRDGRDDKLHAGAVADYVMPILPEVISTDKDDIHSMNYANAAWVVSTSLTPYVSKHEEEIERLKARVKYLESRLKVC